MIGRIQQGLLAEGVVVSIAKLCARFGTLGKVEEEFLLRSDNGLVFTSLHFTAIVRSYGLQQEFITPHCPQ